MRVGALIRHVWVTDWIGVVTALDDVPGYFYCNSLKHPDSVLGPQHVDNFKLVEPRHLTAKEFIYLTDYYGRKSLPKPITPKGSPNYVGAFAKASGI